MNIKIQEALKEHIETVNCLSGLSKDIELLAGQISAVLKKGNKILLMGNGGSASDCQHFAAELVGRYKKERKGLRALALTTDTSILTAVGNDYSFDDIFSRQVEALAVGGDMAIGISTSGESPNITKGLGKAKESGCYTAALLGRKGGIAGKIADLPVIVPSENTPRIQECHAIIIHILCDILEEEF